MHIPTVANILPLIVLLVVARADWEVFNGPDDAQGDEFNLVAENLIPAEGARAKGHKANQRNSASLDQAKKQNVDLKTDIKNKDSKKQVENPSEVSHSTKSATNKETNNISNVKKNTPQASTAGPAATMDKVSTTPKTLNNFDDIDIKSEGFLLVEDVKQSRISRKLAQFFELFSQESQESVEETNDFDDWDDLSEDEVTGKHQHLLEDETNHVLVDVKEGIQPLADSLRDGKEEEVEVLDINYVDPSLHKVQTIPGDLDQSLKLACIDYLSWECLMFREDYMAMKNMSLRTSGRERIKRQASGGIGSTRGPQQMGHILGCETGECFSGNDTDPNVECVPPHFSFGFKAKLNTNRPSLDPTSRQDIASEAIQQLSQIFQDVPGFTHVSIDPDKIVRTTNGELNIPWTVNLDDGKSEFYGMSGQDVHNLIVGPLTRAADFFNTNFTIDGQHLKNTFSGSDAADQVTGQATDPCNPSPCSNGFGSCENKPCPYSDNTGIKVVCTDNCYTHPSCGTNGVCGTDMVGKAHCNCSREWAGVYCDRANDTATPLPVKTVPNFNFTSQSKFNTTMKPSDLTPEKRAEIAKNLTDQLKDVLKNVPGFQNVTVNPDDIRIEDGQLVVDWGAALDPNAYSGKNPNDIGDTVLGSLLNVSDPYRNGVVIDGQKPVEDFDAVGAADQIVKAASDPCSTRPCPVGYDNKNCIAVDSTHVTCIHNCNNFTVCENGGMCQTDSVGAPYCQCPSGWSGKSCNESNKQLDGGEITGIVLGAVLLASGVIGCCCWFLLARKGQRDVNFTTYTDEECRSSFSSPSSGMFVIDRPNVRRFADPMFSASPYTSPQGSQASNSDNGS